MNLFFCDTPEAGMLKLGEDESRHCLKVLRMGPGDIIHATDGNGNLYEAEISGTSGGLVTAMILKTSSGTSRGFRLHVAIAPTKNADRFEWFLEKAAEMGIDEVTPLFCMHSERNRVNMARLQKILVSAVKQSLKTRLPALNEPVSFRDFMNSVHEGSKYIASCLRGNEPEIQHAYTKGSDAVVLVGPEGDFSEAEIEMAAKAGFVAVSLGESRLRTETAGVYVTAVINLLNRV